MRPASVACFLAADIPEDTFVTHEYQRRVDDFKDQFKNARQGFSDSLQVEIIEGVHRQGMRTSKSSFDMKLICMVDCRAKYNLGEAEPGYERVLQVR